ncbi:MAG: VTT domain-containing protein [Puniceicoccaceae bacterium]
MMQRKFWIFLAGIGIAGLAGLVVLLQLLKEGYSGEAGLILAKMIGISLGTFASEDLACIGAGLLASSGEIGLGWAIIAAYMGILIGDTIIFAAGYFIGQPLLQHRWARWFISERAVRRAGQLFEKHGLWIILATRFLPGTRTATYFAGGSLHAPFLKFVAAFALAAAAWTPLLVGVSYLVGQSLLEIYGVYEAFTLPAIIAAGLLVYLVFHYGLPLFSWKGRRRLKGKWIRAVRWEYWPWWQVYWLVVLYILYLGFVRYRRPSLFTAVNPSMPHGGFLGESKSDILDGLAASGESLAKWQVVPVADCNERFDTVKSLMSNLGLAYPVVLKPDEGQRGQSVGILRDDAGMLEWLSRYEAAAILQEYIAGKEYGIFYVRHPGEESGKIVSITLKEQLEVTGNGTDSLEDIIHSHPRAIAMLDTFLDRFQNDLDRIPDDGERIQLGELGTHALGSLFLDGKHLLTPELEKAVDAIAKNYDGFYFGRFDIKAPDDDALMRGEDLRVLELNGLTSEATHIYDPGNSLFTAWSVLCWQWRTAFEIAAKNERNGHVASTAGDFLNDYRSARRRQKRFN